MTSCNKGKDYTVKGRLLEDCTSKNPVANQTFRFISEGSKGSSAKAGLDRTVTTNANGEFEFTYNSKDVSVNGIYLNDYFGEYKNELIPAHTDVNIGDFPLKNSFPVKVNLSVTNPYTANDTLFILSPTDVLLATIPGPFTNAVFGPYNIVDYSGNFETSDDIISQRARVLIRSNIQISTSSLKKEFYTIKNVYMCDQTEQVFDIEIK